MEFFEEADEVISYWHPREYYQGWISTMHGGVLSTLIDEIAGWVVLRKLQTTGVTSHLDVKYRHPVSTNDRQLTIRAHITDKKRNLVTIAATIEDANGTVCVEGEALYYCFDEQRAHAMGFTKCEVDDEQFLPM